MEKTEELAECTMELTDFMANEVREYFNCEIEMLKGSVDKLPDGRTRYKFQIGQEKGSVIRDFIMHALISSVAKNDN